jgi:predicted GNAT superfamily acetyltransferase
MLYVDVFKRAIELGITRVICEVNLQPPNPGSAKFHAAHGFDEVSKATIIDYSEAYSDGKTLQRLCRVNLDRIGLSVSCPVYSR